MPHTGPALSFAQSRAFYLESLRCPNSIPVRPAPIPPVHQAAPSAGTWDPQPLTGMVEKDALLALAPVGGHGQLHTQRLAGRRGVVDGGIDHLVDGVQQAGDVLGVGREEETTQASATVPFKREAEGLLNPKR